MFPNLARRDKPGRIYEMQEPFDGPRYFRPPGRLRSTDLCTFQDVPAGKDCLNPSMVPGNDFRQTLCFCGVQRLDIE